MFKVNNKKTPERRQWHRSAVFIVDFEHMSHLVLVLLLLTLNMELPIVHSNLCILFVILVYCLHWVTCK